MGQPAFGLALRVGRSQLWAHGAGAVASTNVHAEQLHRLYQGERFSRLFVRCLLWAPQMRLNFWQRDQKR